MKIRYIFTFVATALLFTNCMQNEIDVPMNVVTVEATMEGELTKSTADENGNFLWATGDNIAIHAGENAPLLGKYASGAGTSSATFTYTSIGDAPDFTAATYPYNTGHRFYGTELTFVMPAQYELGANVSNTNAPMLAVLPEVQGRTTQAPNFSFSHLGGVFCFTYVNVPAGADKFTLSLGDKKINGTFTATVGEDPTTIATGDTEEANEKLTTLKFDATAEVQNLTLYVPVPTGVYENITATLYAGEEVLDAKSGAAQNTVNRRTLVRMPAITFGEVSGDIDNSVKTEAELCEAIAAGGTVALSDNIVTTTYLSITNDVTIDLNGKTLEREGTTGQRTIFYVTGSNELTLTGEGTVKGTEVVWAAGTSVVNIEGGHYVMNTTDESFPLIYSKGGTINVKGGKFESVRPDNDSFAVTQYNLLNVKDNCGGSIVVTGGEFKNFNPAYCYSEGDPTSFVAAGYKVINKDTGATVTAAHDVTGADVWYQVVADPAAQLQMAINSGNATLQENVVTTTYLSVTNNVTIDLNGKTLEREGTTGQRTIFYVTGSNELTLTGEGTVKGTEVVWAAGTSVVNIEGGHYVMNTTDESFPLIYSKGGTINVKGGKFESVRPDNDSFAVTQYNLLNVKDNCGGSIVVTGGEFKNFNPAYCYSEGDPTSFVAAGYKVINKDTGATVTAAHDVTGADVWYQVVAE